MKLLLRSILALGTTIAAAPICAGQLTINVSGVTSDSGKVYVAIYDRPDLFPIQGRQRAGPILASDAHTLTAHFSDLPPGQYAAVAFQDSNGNGELDKGLFGAPKEPYGFSNSARGFAGPPKFKDAAVALDSDATTTIAAEIARYRNDHKQAGTLR